MLVFWHDAVTLIVSILFLPLIVRHIPYYSYVVMLLERSEVKS